MRFHSQIILPCHSAAKVAKTIPSARSQDSCPIKLLPLLPESIYSPIMAFVPSALPLDHIRFHIQHAPDNLPGKQISLRPPRLVLDDMAKATVHLKPYVEVRHLLDWTP